MNFLSLNPLPRPILRSEQNLISSRPMASAEAVHDFKSRIQKSISNGDIETLQKSQALAELMPQLVDYLEENPHPQNVQAALQFLMGDAAYVPSGFPECQELPAGVSMILKNLLSTQNNSWLCSSATARQASPKQAIEDLKDLRNAFQLIGNLKEWANSDGFPLAASQQEKMGLIKDALAQHHQRGGHIPSTEDIQNLVNNMPAIDHLQRWAQDSPTAEIRKQRDGVLRNLQRNRLGDPILLSLNKPSGPGSFAALEGLPIAPIVKQIFVCRPMDGPRLPLFSFEGLPKKLPRLDCVEINHTDLKSIAEMPEAPRLKDLDLTDNNITSLADAQEMPNLVKLVLCGNPISSLDAIPQSMLNNPRLTIDLQFCPLDMATFRSINAEIFNDQAIQARILLEYPQLKSIPEMAGLLEKLISQVTDIRELSALDTMLERLSRSECFLGPERVISTRELLDIMKKMVDEKPFREYCLAACEGVGADCHDNVQAVFDGLRLARHDPAYNESATLHEIVDFHRKSMNDRLLAEFVTKKCPGGEQLESHMLLRHELSKDNPDLFAITYNAISHERFGMASNDIEKYMAMAKQHLAENATDRNLIQQMAKSPSFISLMERQHSEDYDHFVEQWAGKLEKLIQSQHKDGIKPEDMKKIEGELDTIRKNIFSSPPSVSHKALDVLLEQLPIIGDGKLFHKIQAVAKEVWAIEMAEDALNDSREDNEAADELLAGESPLYRTDLRHISQAASKNISLR